MLPKTADVVVVGAGIVGCSAAYQLAAAGAGAVLLVDREDAVGRGSTGACAGGFRHQFTSEVNVRLSQASIPMILGFEEEHGIAVDVSQDGYLFVVRDEETWRHFEGGLARQRALGVVVDVLEADEAAALIPGLDVSDVVGATFGPRDGIADPGGLTQGYAKIAQRSGAHISLGTEVLGLRAAGGRIEGVLTASGEVLTANVVLATGAWSRELGLTAGIDLPIQPVPRVVVTTGPFPGVPERRTLVIDMPSTFYFHREAGGVLMGMGGPDEPSFDTRVDESFVSDGLLPVALKVFPPLAGAGIRGTWAGLYEMTPDRLPIVGPTSVNGLWVGAGFSGHGFQHGPVVGKLLAEMVTRGAARTVDISDLDYDRFGEGTPTAERHVV